MSDVPTRGHAEDGLATSNKAAEFGFGRFKFVVGHILLGHIRQLCGCYETLYFTKRKNLGRIYFTKRLYDKNENRANDLA